jgi:hypothetical protein
MLELSAMYLYQLLFSKYACTVPASAFVVSISSEFPVDEENLTDDSGVVDVFPMTALTSVGDINADGMIGITDTIIIVMRIANRIFLCTAFI